MRTKLTFINALLLVSATVGMFETAWATADGPDFFSVRDVAANDVLYVRQKPSADSAKVGQIPYNARGIRNMGCHAFHKGQEVVNSDIPRPGTTLWCKVRYQKSDGWVNARFLKEDAETQDAVEQEIRKPAEVASAPTEGLHGPAAKAIQTQIKKARIQPAEVIVFYGDLTGQRTNDAISLVYSPFEGGNGIQLTTWVWRESNGAYKLTRTVDIGELFGESPRNVKFSPGRISVTTTVPKPDDPRCCPTGVRTFTILVR